MFNVIRFLNHEVIDYNIVILPEGYNMEYCGVCGEKLILKECGVDGEVTYCSNCSEFRFPMFSSAISAIILNPSKDKILLIQQYGKKDNILVAGYIN